MLKHGQILTVIVVLGCCISISNCGITSGGRSGDAGGGVYSGGVQKSSGYNGFRRNMNYMNSGNNGNQKTLEQQKTETRSRATGSGMSVSAWGIISITFFIIILGAVAYYGSMCYPLICRNEQNYDIMDISSSGSQTPTKSADQFDKLGNYSSRSTTPSKSNEFTEI